MRDYAGHDESDPDDKPGQLPLARLAREPGSAVTWEDHVFPGTTAFVVELPAGPLTASATARYALAVLDVARRP